jgi:hypothetical protein
MALAPGGSCREKVESFEGFEGGQIAGILNAGIEVSTLKNPRTLKTPDTNSDLEGHR